MTNSKRYPNAPSSSLEMESSYKSQTTRFAGLFLLAIFTVLCVSGCAKKQTLLFEASGDGAGDMEYTKEFDVQGNWKYECIHVDGPCRVAVMEDNFPVDDAVSEEGKRTVGWCQLEGKFKFMVMVDGPWELRVYRAD